MTKILKFFPWILSFVLMLIIIYQQSQYHLTIFTSKNPTSTIIDEIVGKKLIDTLIFLTNFPFKENKRYFSRNNEDGILEAILEKIGLKYQYYIEIGVENGGKECKTRFLRERGWQGLLLDKKYENHKINLHKEIINYKTIVSLFDNKYAVPKYFDVFSIDTKMKDYWILRALLKAGYQPRIIIGTINPTIPPQFSISVPKNDGSGGSNRKNWGNNGKISDGVGYGQYSLAAAWKLARKFNYSMIYCDMSRMNYFLVLDGSQGFGEGFRLSDYLQASHFYHPKDGKIRTMKDIYPKGRKWIEV